MKKKLTTFLVLLFFNTVFYAQNFDYSVKAGINQNFLSVSENYKKKPYWFNQISEITSSPNTGFIFENSLNFYITKKLLFNTGLNISSKAETTEYLYYYYDVDSILILDKSKSGSISNCFYSINIPLKTGFSLNNKKIYLFGGVTLSENFASIIKQKTEDSNSINIKKNEQQNNLYITFESNIECFIATHIYFGILFNRDFTFLNNIPNSYYNDYKLSSFALYLSYQFYSANE